MSQAAAQQPSRKKTVISLLVLLALTCIIVFTFKDHWAEITTALAQLSVWQVLAVLAVGISYPLLEGCVAWVIVRSRLPQFTLRQGLDVGWCGTFGNVVTLGAGAVPVQLYYLHRAGLPLGPGAGLMTLEYVFHKSTVLLYATVMLLLQRRWLAANTTGVMRYLPMAYAVVAVIIVALVLLCVSPLVQNLARWLLGFLPKTEKWQQRRADWLEQLEVLSTESRRLLADKPRCLKIFALQALKLFGLFCLPYLCIRFMGLSPLGFWQVQLLTSLMLFVSNALPNVAGMGSIETAFLLVFGSFLERGEVMSVLMLYRIASYYVVFAASAVGFFIAQRHLVQMEPPKEGLADEKLPHSPHRFIFYPVCTGSFCGAIPSHRPESTGTRQLAGHAPHRGSGAFWQHKRHGLSPPLHGQRRVPANGRIAFHRLLLQKAEPELFCLHPRYLPGAVGHRQLL